MARRSDHTKEELKALAIQSGLAIIDEKGFSGFSARAAASGIGYTVGTLYHTFGSLDGYILHLNAHTLDAWYAELEKALKKQKGEPVEILAKAYLHFARTHYPRWSALFEHRMAENAELPDWYAHKLARFFTLLEDVLLPYANDNPKKARRMGHVLWAGMHGICTLSLSGKLDLVNAEPAEKLAESLVVGYLRGS